jgi:hypothetical protein
VAHLRCPGLLFGSRAVIDGLREYAPYNALGDEAGPLRGTVAAVGLIGEMHYAGDTGTAPFQGVMSGPLEATKIGVLYNNGCTTLGPRLRLGLIDRQPSASPQERSCNAAEPRRDHGNCVVRRYTGFCAGCGAHRSLQTRGSPIYAAGGRSRANRRQNNSPRCKPRSHLTYSIELPGRAEGAEQPISASFDLTLGASAIYTIAGLIFAIVATGLLFACSGIQFLPLRTVGVAWAYAWPIVLALNLLWSSDRRRQLAVVAVYIGVIAVLCMMSAFGGSRPSTIATIAFPAFANPILLWGIFAGPSVFLLLFQAVGKRVRAE